MFKLSYAGDSRTIAKLFLFTISGFAVLCVAALAAVRLEHMYPETRIFAPSVFSQLLSLHRVLLQYFVVLPALPAVVGLALLPAMCGSPRLSFPRLALVSWILFALGGLLVIWAFLGASIDANWAYAAGSAAAASSVSVTFLAGLIAGTLALGLLSLNIIATLHSADTRSAPILAMCFYGTAVLQLLALPLIGSALVLATGASLGWVTLSSPSTGGDPALLAFLIAIAAKPLKMSVLLPSIGIASWLISAAKPCSAAQANRARAYVIVLVIGSCLAFDTRALPGSTSALLLIVSAFFSVLLLAPLCALMFGLFFQHLRQPPAASTPRIYAAAVAMLVFLLAPVDVFMQLPGMNANANTYLASTTDYLLVAGCAMLTLTGALHHLHARNPQSGKIIAGVVLAGLAAMVLPMIPLGLGGLSLDFAVYPRQALPLQVLSAYGGLFLAIGLLAGILQISLQRTPDPKIAATPSPC